MYQISAAVPLPGMLCFHLFVSLYVSWIVQNYTTDILWRGGASPKEELVSKSRVEARDLFSLLKHCEAIFNMFLDLSQNK